MAVNRIGRTELRNLGLASLGAMLEYYDFVVFVFVAVALGKSIFPEQMSPWLRDLQVFSIYAIGYFVRPVAGLVVAHFADRIGRKRLFVITIFMMSVPTFLMGLLPSFAQIGVAAPVLLLVLRILQGCAVGGELPSAAVFIAEHAPPRRLFLASGSLHGVVHLGLLLGAGSAALAALVAGRFPEHGDLAWRLPFIVGGLFGLTAAYLRRSLEESPLFAQLHAERKAAVRLPLATVLRDYRKACGFGLLVFFVQSVTSSVFLQYMSSYMITQFHIPAATVFSVNAAGVLCLAASMPLWGMAADRFGFGRVAATGAVAAALTGTWFFTHLAANQGDFWALLWSLALVGGTCSCVIALVPGLIASLFPTAVRQTGYAIPYNFGSALFSGAGPLALAWAVRSFGVIAPLYVFLVGCGVAILAALLVSHVTRYLGRAAHPTATDPAAVSAPA